MFGFRLLAFILAFLFGGSNLEAGEAGLALDEKIYGLSKFWKEADYNFIYFNRHPEINWDQTYTDFLHKIQKTKTDLEYYRLLQKFAATLQDSHTKVSLPKEMISDTAGMPAIELESIEGKPIVVNTGENLKDSVPIGSEILMVEQIPVEEFLRENIFPYLSASTEQAKLDFAIRGRRRQGLGLLFGPIGSIVNITIEAPDGRVQTLSVERFENGALINWLQPPKATVPNFEFRWITEEIAYIALNSFLTQDIVERFKEKLPELQPAKAVILDIRNNGGGNSEYGGRIGAYFSPDPLKEGPWRTRNHIATYKAWGAFGDNEYTPYFEGTAYIFGERDIYRATSNERILVPLVVLVGPKTYSAAEDFAVLMSQIDNLTFVGEKTSGSTGQPFYFELLPGVRAQVTTKNNLLQDETEFIGFGFSPDIKVITTVADIQANRDPALDAAIEFLKGKF